MGFQAIRCCSKDFLVPLKAEWGGDTAHISSGNAVAGHGKATAITHTVGCFSVASLNASHIISCFFGIALVSIALLPAGQKPCSLLQSMSGVCSLETKCGPFLAHLSPCIWQGREASPTSPGLPQTPNTRSAARVMSR